MDAPIASPPRRSWVPRLGGPALLGLLALVLLVLFVARERGELVRTIRLIRTASPAWLLIAVGCGAGIQLATALAYRATLRRLGYRLPFRALAAALLRRQVVGTIVPLGGPASAWAFARAIERRGVAYSDALYASVVNGVLWYLAFVLFLTPVIVVDALRGTASWLEIVAAAALTAAILLLVVVMLAAARANRHSGRLPSWLPKRVAAFINDIRAHGLRPRDFALPLAFHLSVEFFGVALMYAALRAVDADAAAMTAVVGYAIGSLFYLVAPIFQGIGAVELSMTVVLTRFGVSGGAALAAVLVYRLVDLWLPFAIGVSAEAGGRREVRRGASHLPATLTFATGLASVLSVISPRFGARFDRVEDYAFFYPGELSRQLTLVAGFFLIFLSYSLWRRKRVAWVVSLVLLTALTIAHIAKRHDEIVALLAGANIAVLVLQRAQYRVRSDIPTIQQGLVRFALSLLFAVVYGTLGFFLIDERAFGIDFSAAEALRETLRAFFNLGVSDLVPRTRYASWFLDSLAVIGAVSAGYAVFSLARPVVWRRTTYAHERQRARELIERWGDSSLDAFKYADDKVFYFASNDRGVVSFGISRATAVSLGDPTAASDEDFRLVLDEFLDFCATNGWRPAFHQVSPHRLPAYRAAGLSAIKVGEDGIVDLERFSTAGSSMKTIRNTIHRLERAGYRVAFYPPPQPEARLRRLRDVSNEWLRHGGHRERYFTLGRWDDDYLRSSPIYTVEGPDGEIVAFANLVPDGVDGEATIDLMRRLPEPDGVMDLLFVRIFEHLRAEGYRRFSLGLAPFANVGLDESARLPERIIGQFYERLNRAFSYKGLRAYKDKFQPAWEPRYLVYTSDAALPIVTLAIVQLTE